jgi:hypothetical protein
MVIIFLLVGAITVRAFLYIHDQGGLGWFDGLPRPEIFERPGSYQERGGSRVCRMKARRAGILFV